MKRFPSFLHDTGNSLGANSRYLEELRESFTDSFAYDLFTWPETARGGSVDFRPLKLQPTSQQASETANDGTDDPVTAYTSNADIPIYKTGYVVAVEEGSGVAPQSNVSGPLVGIDDFRVDARFDDIDGTGYTIAVLDGGIDLDDPFFGPDLNNDGISDRIVYSYDFADGDSNASDVDGHGSNVASIAASSDATYTGMAPGANIAALKVFTDAGGGNFGYLEDALQWVIANAEAYNIVSVNMSLGNFTNFNTPAQLYGVADEMATLAALDVIVVSSSGNDFYEFNSVQGVSYPSADPNSLSVGAVYEGSYGKVEYLDGAIDYTTGADRIASFSQRDDELTDIFAPGAFITGAGHGAGLVTTQGTSQAAPHISGIIALAQQLAVREIGRKLTYDEFAEVMKNSGDTIIDGDDENDNVTNTGLAFERVNVVALGEAILDLAGESAAPAPSFFQVSAVDANQPEGNGGRTAYSFTITRSGDLSRAESLDYSASGSGTDPAAPADFLGGAFPSGSVTFAAGETSKVVTVEVADDSNVEPDEGFTLTIENPPASGQIVIPEAEATIENDDDDGGGASGQPVVLLQADFNNTADTEGFTYSDGIFGGSSRQIFARGGWDDQALDITLGGITNSLVRDISGGWETEFVLTEEMEVTLSFLYRLTLEEQYESNEFTQVLVSIDGGPPILVDQLTGNGNGGADDTTGTQNFTAVLGTLSAGSHSLAIGGYNNQKTWSDETSYLTIDDVLVTGLPTDAPPPPSPPPADDIFFAIAADQSAAPEGDAGASAFTFTVTRSGNTTGTASVDYAVTGSHVDGADFLGGALPGGTVSFAAGETSKTITIEVSGDSEIEVDEGFGVVLSNPSAGAAITTAGAISIIETDDAAQAATSYDIAAASAIKAEGDSGTVAFTFDVTRSGDASKIGLVSYAVTSGDTDASDFAHGLLPHGALFFAVGETSKTITVDVAGDTALEGHETFGVNLFNALGGAAIGTGTATGTISDDDTPGPSMVAIAALDAVKAEGDAGITEFTFEVIRSGSTAWTASVYYTVDYGTANQADFLNGVNSRLFFYPGETSKTITVGVKGDRVIEPDETFAVTLYSPSAGLEITTASANALIINDEATPTTFIEISALDAVKAEGDAGATPFTFTVTRSGDTSASETVSYVQGYVSGGGSADTHDFVSETQPISGTIEFLAGEASKTLTIDVQGDTYNEMDERFLVKLTSASGNSAIITESVEAQILNDDFYENSLLSIAREFGPWVELNSHTSGHTFLVTRTGNISTSITLDYAVTGDDVDGADFVGGVLPSGTITFSPQQKAAGIRISVNGDRDFEPDEVFTVTLSNPSEGAEIVIASAESTILNDDQEPGTTFYEISAVNAVQTEGDSGDTLYNFTITRSGDLTFSSSIKYSLIGAGANPASADDFATGLIDSGITAFSANQASKTITIRVSGDTDFEPDEGFSVNIFDATAEGVVLTGSATGTILNDDSAPANTFLAVTANDQTKAEGDDGPTAFTFTVTRSGDASQAASVDYSVTGGTANRVDFVGFQMPSGTVEFAAGETRKTFTIDVRGDFTSESNESFTVWLSNPSDGMEITTGNANSTILNDDEEVPATSFLWIKSSDTRHEEGDADTTTFTFGIERKGDLHPAGSVDYYVSARSADASDFPGGVLPSGRIFFAEDETFKTFTVEIAGDTDFEFNEQFGVTLTNPSAGLDVALDSARGTIFNDDAPPPGESAVLLAADFNPGSGSMHVFNYFDGALGILGDLRYVHGNYTSNDLRIWMGGVDDNEVNGASGGWKSEFYVPESMEVSLAFDYQVNHAGAFESDEFTQVLFNIDGGAIQLAAQIDGDSGSSADVSTGPMTYQASLGTLEEGYHTLVLGGYLNHKDAIDEESEIFFDNVLVTGDFAQAAETFVTIAAEEAVKAEGDAGTTAYTFAVTRTGDTSGSGSVDWSVSGTSIDAGDFVDDTLPGGTVDFAAGEANKIITVEVSGDTNFEADESFTVTLSNASTGSQVITASAEGTILNDDVAPPSTFYEFVTGTAKHEGDIGATEFTFYVDRSGDVSGIESLDYTVTSSEADGNDFFGGALPSGIINFAAGQTRQALSIEVTGDTDFEPDEIFTVTLSNPSAGGKITGASAGGKILNDDPDPASSFFKIRADDTAKAEGDSGTTAFTFLVTRSGNTSGTSSVDWTTSGGADAADFGGILPGGTLVFGAGDTSKMITVDVAGDTDYESNEFFSVLLSNPSAGSEITTAAAWGTILNDDAAPPATFLAINADDAVRAEGDAGTTEYTFTVTRSGDTTGAGTVDWAVSDADVDATDFGGSLPAGGVSFAAGEASKTVTVQVAGDTDFEGDENFTVTLSNPSAGAEITTASAQGTILNDDAPPPSTFLAINADDAAKAEGDTGTTAFTFTVTRSGDISSAGTVDYTVISATADGGDFAGGALPAGTVNFGAGEASKTLTIGVAGDTDIEDAEGFSVGLSNASPGSAITKAYANGTIMNDDVNPITTYVYLSQDYTAKPEGQEGATPYSFTLIRSGDTSEAGSVDYIITSSVADGSDFFGGLLPSGTVNFAAGETMQKITLQISGDTDIEDNEDFTVTLSNPSVGSEISSGSSIGTILNDDAAPPGTFLAIFVEHPYKFEGDAGVTDFNFTVTRTGDTSGAGSVDYAVTSGTSDGSDFAGGAFPSGIVNFAAGEISKTIAIGVAGDTVFESPEAFIVRLSNATGGATITEDAAIVTILNDDAAPTTSLAIAAEDAVKAEGDAGTTEFTFTVTRSGDTTEAGSVDYAVNGGDIEGGDFAGGILPNGSVVFAAGETSKTVTIDVAGDSDIEGDEAFTVTLSNPSDGAAITTASAAGTILNDDSAPPSGPIVLIDADFNAGGDTGGFVYQDGSFGGSTAQSYADGAWSGGALKVDIGGIDNTTATNLSGGWTTDFTLDQEAEVSLSFLYELLQSEDYEADEYSQLLVSIDGGTPVVVNSLTGNGNGGGDQTTGSQTYSAMLGLLAAGDHSLTIGGFNNKKTWSNEFTEVTIDDVSLVAQPTQPITSSFSIAAQNALLIEGDSASTAFTFTVTRSGDTSSAGSVDYAVGGGDVDGADFLGGLLPSGTLAFAAGEIARTVVLDVAGDGDFEADEAFTVTLSNPAPGSDIATASASGTILNDDAPPAGALVLVAADFDAAGDTGGFTYSDGVFGGGAVQSDASGGWDGGRLIIDLGGGANTTVIDMSGAWEIDFTLAVDMDVELSFTYELLLTSRYEADEFSQVLASVDGGAPILIEEIFGDGNGGSDDTSGLQEAILDLGILEAGSHTLSLGGYNNKKTWSDESTEVSFDHVVVTGTAPASGSSLAGLVEGDNAQSFANFGTPESELLSLTGI